MIVEYLQLKLRKEKDGLLSHLDEILGQISLLGVVLLSSSTTSFNEVQHFWQDQVHVRKQTCLVLRIDLKEQLHDFDWLDVDHLVDHLEDGVCELDHGLRDVEHDLFQHCEEGLIQNVIVLLEHCHQNRNQHRHEWHAVRLILDDVANAVQADFVMVAKVWVYKHF